MKKVGIVTMIDNNNCGNRLQNYAMQELIKKLGFDVYTLKNEYLLNWDEKYYYNFIRQVKRYIFSIGKNKKFKKFNKKIKFSKSLITVKTNPKKINKKYDFFVAGSDQMWKPTRRRMSHIDLLGFAFSNKRIAYAPSFGIDNIEKKYYKILQEELPKFKAISVREDAGKKIIDNATGIKNVEVVLDPTMLLNNNDWEKLEEKPVILKKEKFIFTYFLGDEDINILKKQFNEKEYQFIDFYENDFGPQEFLYLIRNAELVLTDSFHACVFSIIFNTNFYIFERKQSETNNNMNSRIDTLTRIFELKNRRINNFGSINLDVEINYSLVNKILEEERKKSLEFLKKSLDIE